MIMSLEKFINNYHKYSENANYQSYLDRLEIIHLGIEKL